jgi:2-methylisocitrate lyase-like PEP mutase family enzyme
MLTEVLERAKRYRDVGADGLFVPASSIVDSSKSSPRLRRFP